MLDAANPLAANYRRVRESMRSGPERTRLQEDVLIEARQLAKKTSFDAEEVARWVRQGSDGQRIAALAMMQGNAELRDFEAVLISISESRSAFEQYHALALAVEMIDGLSPVQRRRLVATVKAVRNFRFRRDTERWSLSEKILQRSSE
ncbi:hypothetical protein ACH4OY_20060 [Micromonospora rubida]|uniref:Uncharacterized protein n=1 Tax=Micromonospora rubida TaxID=2697657 RepID=A0ABW7SMN6_9ACTN